MSPGMKWEPLAYTLWMSAGILISRWLWEPAMLVATLTGVVYVLWRVRTFDIRLRERREAESVLRALRGGR